MPQREVDWSNVDASPISTATFGIVQPQGPTQVILTFAYQPSLIRMAVDEMSEEDAIKLLEDTPMHFVNPVRVMLPLESAANLARAILQMERLARQVMADDDDGDEGDSNE